MLGCGNCLSIDHRHFSNNIYNSLRYATAAQPFGSLEFVRHVYGSGLAMRLATEQKIAREQEFLARAPGLEASNLYGEIVSGKDTTIDFGDFLSLPENRPNIPMEKPHDVVERRLGMF